jgi:hypothetical protein
MEPRESQPDPAAATAAAQTEWFRPPTRREHGMAAALFVFFGLFFLALFVVTSGWWFRWVIAGLGIYSILHGAGHARDYFRRRGDG